MKKKLAILISLLFVASTFGVASVLGKSGGPDNFGYTFIDSNDDPQLKSYYPWIEIKDTGTKVTSWAGGCDDGSVYNIPLGFNFKFYGRSISQVEIVANGYIYLGPANDFIYAFSRDLYPCCADSGVYYETKVIGGRKVFVLEYYQVPLYGDAYCSNYRNTFQLQLHEGSNNIVMVYKTLDPAIISGNIGIYKNDPLDQLFYSSGPTNYVIPSDGTVIIFQYPGSQRYPLSRTLPMHQILKILKENKDKE